MLRALTLDKNVLPFKIEVSFDEFQEQYILSKKTKSPEAIAFVYEQLLPTFSIWDFKLKNEDYYSDITIYTFLRLLQADDKTPGTIENKLRLLYKHLTFFQLTFLDLCIESLMLHLNKKSYIPMYKYSKPKDLFYYIAKEIKMFLFSIVRKLINYERKQEAIDFSCLSQEEYYYDKYLDIQILKTLDQVQYSHYLYLLLTGLFPSKNNLNYNTKFIKDHLICRLTKMLLSSN
jgi:hypothetical protein